MWIAADAADEGGGFCARRGAEGTAKAPYAHLLRVTLPQDFNDLQAGIFTDAGRTKARFGMCEQVDVRDADDGGGWGGRSSRRRGGRGRNGVARPLLLRARGVQLGLGGNQKARRRAAQTRGRRAEASLRPRPLAR